MEIKPWEISSTAERDILVVGKTYDRKGHDKRPEGCHRICLDCLDKRHVGLDSLLVVGILLETPGIGNLIMLDARDLVFRIAVNVVVFGIHLGLLYSL